MQFFSQKKFFLKKKFINKRNISRLKKILFTNTGIFGRKKPIIKNTFAKIKISNNNNTKLNLKNNFHLNEKKN